MTGQQPYVWSDDNNNLVEYCEPAAQPVSTEPTPTVDTPAKLVKTRERRQVERKVVYPYFLEYTKCTDDPYWQQVLDDCARSKFPRGSSYDAANRTICIRSTKTPVFYKVRNLEQPTPTDEGTECPENPEILDSIDNDGDINSPVQQTFDEIKQFFRTHLNLSSAEDQKQMNAVHDGLKEKSDERYSKSWNDINLKKIRSAIIRDYIITQGAIHGLSTDEKIESYKTVKIGLLFGWIEKSHIIYKDRQIVEIKSLKYNPEKRVFDIDGVDTKDVSASIVKYKPKVQRMDALWK